jgi:hypothetical protein
LTEVCPRAFAHDGKPFPGDPAALGFKSPKCPSLGSIAKDSPGVIFEAANGILARSNTSCSALAAVGSFPED